MDYEAFFAGHLRRLHDEGRYRVFAELERVAGAFPRARFHQDGTVRDVTVWCSNDYLAMGQHPVVIEAMQAAIGAQGSGAGGTRNISGTNTLHVALERELATLHDKEAALVFTSGYVANETTLATLGTMLPGCELYSDAYNHASMIAGIRHSGAVRRIFRHNDVAHLEELLTAADPATPKIVAFESVYSMDGDISPIEEICDLAHRHGALDLSRRGPCRRHVRPARRGRGRARRRARQGRHRAGHARQGVRRGRRLHRLDRGHRRLRALLRLGLHLLDLDAACHRRRRTGQHPPRHAPIPSSGCAIRNAPRR